VRQVEVAVIGTGWCGGIRAETLARSALVDKLHICEIKPERLAEVKARVHPATATLDVRPQPTNTHDGNGGLCACAQLVAAPAVAGAPTHPTGL
jgi:hypothetical protein